MTRLSHASTGPFPSSIPRRIMLCSNPLGSGDCSPMERYLIFTAARYVYEADGSSFPEARRRNRHGRIWLEPALTRRLTSCRNCWLGIGVGWPLILTCFDE